MADADMLLAKLETGDTYVRARRVRSRDASRRCRERRSPSRRFPPPSPGKRWETQGGVRDRKSETARAVRRTADGPHERVTWRAESVGGRAESAVKRRREHAPPVNRDAAVGCHLGRSRADRSHARRSLFRVPSRPRRVVLPPPAARRHALEDRWRPSSAARSRPSPWRATSPRACGRCAARRAARSIASRTPRPRSTSRAPRPPAGPRSRSRARSTRSATATSRP